MPTAKSFPAFFLLAGVLGTAPSVHAEPAALAAADPTRVTPKLLKTCAKCHYESGISDDPEMPHLAGQRASYLFKQLQDFKADARDGGRMNKIAKRLDEQEMADLAVLFGGKPLPAEPGVAPPAAPSLVTAGDAGRGIESCASCHGDDGRGLGGKYDAPALAGMPLLYFENMMAAFRDGERANDADGVMRDAAKGLSDDEIGALARYYLALGGRQPLPE
jgi:cytochrome c553